MLPNLYIKPNTIYVPNNHVIPEINDHIAFGSYASMKEYMNILFNCDDLLSKRVKKLNPHLLTYHNIISQNISLELVPLDYHLVSEAGPVIPKGWVTDKTLPLP